MFPEFATGEIAIIQASYLVWTQTNPPAQYTYSIDSENVITLLDSGVPVSTSDPEYLALVAFIEAGNDYEFGLGYLGDVKAEINGVETFISVT